MKGMKGKLLKKLKSIRPIGYLKQDRILQVSASDGYADHFMTNPNPIVQTQLLCKEQEEENKIDQSCIAVQEPDIIDVSELMRDLGEDEMDFDDDIDNKENIGPPIKVKNPVASKDNSIFSEPEFRQNGNSEVARSTESITGNTKHTPLSEIDISSFRRPDLNSGSLFDPNLLAAFNQALIETKAHEVEMKPRIEESNLENDDVDDEPPSKAPRVEDINPLLDFEEKCPPGGSESVILYTTGLRGIRKTFEDCNSIRFLLESFRVLFFERDVSMHLEFREELWRILGVRAVPPRLFIKGRYIGGAEEVLGLHEQGKFRPLFEGVPIDRSEGPCEGCAGVRFVMCFNCSGSCKVIVTEEGNDGLTTKCPECNENGLIICPICC